MSLIRAKAIQMGYDATASNNFLIYQPLTPDGTFRIANGNQGATTDIMTVSSAGNVTFAGSTNFASLNFGSGTESAPSLYPTGDSNTGIWFPAADTFAVSTGGTQRLRITSAGDVGVGISAPSSYGKFTVQTSGGTETGLAVFSPSTTNGAKITLYDNNFNAQLYTVPSGGTTNFAISVAGTERLRIDNNGNVLLTNDIRWGTWTSGSSGQVIAASTAASGTLQMYTAGSERLRIDSTGTVFLGGATTALADNAKMVVNGTAFTTTGAAGDIYKGHTLVIQNNDQATYAAGKSVALGFDLACGNNYNSHAKIVMLKDNSTAGDQSTSLAFWTRSGANNSTIDAERMRITSLGQVGIGATSIANTSVKLQVQAGNAVSSPRGGGNTRFFLTADGTTVGTNYLEIQTPSTSSSDILFSSSSTSQYGIIRYLHSTNTLSLFANNAEIVGASTAGLIPGANATYDLGNASFTWRNIYTNDLHLSNENHEKGNDVDGTKGNWTIQEGEEHLYIINNKSGKKYKFSLEEVQ